ncbi:hypothetical protein Tco_0422899 [Tanacetum coccineum]
MRIQWGGQEFLVVHLGRFINGRFNSFSFTEFKLFPSSRHILFMGFFRRGVGGLHVSKLLLEAGSVPSGFDIGFACFLNTASLAVTLFFPNILVFDTPCVEEQDSDWEENRRSNLNLDHRRSINSISLVEIGRSGPGDTYSGIIVVVSQDWSDSNRKANGQEVLELKYGLEIECACTK